jgi:formylglycine-generating enzyme required for sulfatase activity
MSGCAINATVLGLNATCYDGLQNGDETGVDCGGDLCKPCADAPDAGSSAASDAAVDVEAGSRVCPSGGDTPMVLVPSTDASFCIDTIETTDLQYSRFLATIRNAPGIQPVECQGAPSHVPAAPIAPDDLPVANVNWCDAYAYCAWAGKRLCQEFAPANDARDTEWYLACSQGGALAYPYGAAYVATACNGSQNPAGGRLPSGSLSSCVGGYPGIFDMSGNVWEWEASCTSASGGPLSDRCRARGGGYISGVANLSCHGDSETPDNFDGGLLRSSTSPAVGIRCCADPLAPDAQP